MAVERDKCVAERARLALGESKLKKIYRRMVPIRRFDDKIAGMYSRGRMTGFCCLYAGEEGVAAGPKYAAAG